MNDQELGRTAYEGYCRASEGRSLVSGAQLPAFEVLPANIQTAWAAAAMAVRDHLAQQESA
jgi:hypothetical protein